MLMLKAFFCIRRKPVNFCIAFQFVHWITNASINVQVKFHIKDMIFRIHDVGGQRSERRKWLYLFDCVHAVCVIIIVFCFVFLFCFFSSDFTFSTAFMRSVSSSLSSLSSMSPDDFGSPCIKMHCDQYTCKCIRNHSCRQQQLLRWCSVFL